jgi:hypothetical protein
VALGAPKRLEELVGPGVLVECCLKVLWNRGFALRRVGIIESSVSLRGLISARPAPFMRPSTISRRARSRLTADHLLRGRRGVKRCRKKYSLWRLSCPSIHPKQTASSIASACVTVAFGEPFLAIFSHTPADWA